MSSYSPPEGLFSPVLLPINGQLIWSLQWILRPCLQRQVQFTTVSISLAGRACRANCAKNKAVLHDKKKAPMQRELFKQQ
jgi:hypothetical protein